MHNLSKTCSTPSTRVDLSILIDAFRLTDAPRNSTHPEDGSLWVAAEADSNLLAA